jgi:hypothetical protein
MSCYNFLYPITITEGGTFDQPFQWSSGEPLEAVDITGFTTKMQIRLKLTDPTPLLELVDEAGPWAADGDSGIYIDTPIEGIFRMYINDTDTMGLCSTHKDLTGIYNCFLYSPDEEAVLRLYGPVTILATAVWDTP